jgi:hypothetical protein
MSKNVILFGAGASFGSEANMPPLGSKLFMELFNFDSNYWGNVPYKYKAIFDNDFEEGMKRLIKDTPELVPYLQRAKALFFSKFSSTESNLYYKFAKRLELTPKQVSIATLNYDLLLQNSFKISNLNLALFKKDSNGIELILPHGSCNLFCNSVYASPEGVFFDPILVKVNGDIHDIELITHPVELRSKICGNAIPPIMSYFEKEKRSTAGEEYLMESRERLKCLIDNAERIIIIGVKIREHDEHIWNPIKHSNAKLIYCSGREERKEFEFFTNKFRSSKENHFVDGFWDEKFDEVFNQII